MAHGTSREQGDVPQQRARLTQNRLTRDSTAPEARRRAAIRIAPLPSNAIPNVPPSGEQKARGMLRSGSGHICRMLILTTVNTVTMEDKVIDLQAAALLLGAHPETVRLKAKAGELPGCKVGKRWVFSTIALESYLAGEWMPRVVQGD